MEVVQLHHDLMHLQVLHSVGGGRSQNVDYSLVETVSLRQAAAQRLQCEDQLLLLLQPLQQLQPGHI